MKCIRTGFIRRVFNVVEDQGVGLQTLGRRSGVCAQIQWNSNAGDLFSPRTEYFIGISPPSGHAVELTHKARRGAGFGCAAVWPMAICRDKKATRVTQGKEHCIFMIQFSLTTLFVPLGPFKGYPMAR